MAEAGSAELEKRLGLRPPLKVRLRDRVPAPSALWRVLTAYQRKLFSLPARFLPHNCDASRPFQPILPDSGVLFFEMNGSFLQEFCVVCDSAARVTETDATPFLHRLKTVFFVLCSVFEEVKETRGYSDVNAGRQWKKVQLSGSREYFAIPSFSIFFGGNLCMDTSRREQ